MGARHEAGAESGHERPLLITDGHFEDVFSHAPRPVVGSDPRSRVAAPEHRANVCSATNDPRIKPSECSTAETAGKLHALCV